MATERHLKKINLDTLEDRQKKLSSVKLRKCAIALVFLIVAITGGYFVIRMLAGDLSASRFAVNNMTCPACVITIKEATEKAPGVVGTDISLAGRDITVKFYEKKTSPEQIEKVIEKAGYPVKLDGLFQPALVDKNDMVAASVNGRPVLMADIHTRLDVDMTQTANPDFPSSFFSAIGKEILLQAADKLLIVVQPQEVAAEIQDIMERQKMSEDQLKEKAKESFGSLEKFSQIVGQLLGILKLVEETVPDNIQDPDQRKQKTIEALGNLFKNSDVVIYDGVVSENIPSLAGKDGWKVFWPRMISSDTELHRILARIN